MFICRECEAIFDEPKTIEEHHPYGMTYATEYWDVCPQCESTDFTEAKQCERCGSLVPELDEGLCDICYDDMHG